jgi:adenylate cyclase
LLDAPGAGVVARPRRTRRESSLRLRRFAPRPIIDRIDRGEPIERGVQDVSVLFADLRGYTAFAEQREPQEVFRAVSRYAQLASRVVSDYGGLIVDFCGDGVMAVFGALEATQDKERAALGCAREIHVIVSANPLYEPLSGYRPDLTHVGLTHVGVGVATGEAFVGEIRAGDRSFWSAVGRTTNLAARLQDLTRQIPCAIAVDAQTYAQAGELGAGLRLCRGVSIRGLHAVEDVFVLPLEPF